MICPPTVTPICASSPAACSAVVTSSVPEGALGALAGGGGAVRAGGRSCEAAGVFAFSAGDADRTGRGFFGVVSGPSLGVDAADAPVLAECFENVFSGEVDEADVAAAALPAAEPRDFAPDLAELFGVGFAAVLGDDLAAVFGDDLAAVFGDDFAAAEPDFAAAEPRDAAPDFVAPCDPFAAVAPRPFEDVAPARGDVFAAAAVPVSAGLAVGAAPAPRRRPPMRGGRVVESPPSTPASAFLDLLLVLVPLPLSAMQSGSMASSRALGV